MLECKTHSQINT